MKRRIAAIAALALGVMWISSALAFDLTDPQSWPFIPVPEIATDPNGGTTVGVLPVFLFTDTKNQIRDIFAPDLNWNQTLGVGGTFRYLSYPNEDTNWYATAGGAQTIARQIDLDYQTGRTHQDLFTFEGRFFFERDPTDRFYGTGNNSSQSNETTYTTQQLYGMASVGLNISDKLQVQLMERPRWVRIQNGAYTSLPQIFQLFPHQKGINGGSEVLTQLVIQYDDRDSVDIPRSGGLYRVYGSVADRALGSSFSYTRFGYEARKYYTVHPRITFAGHVFMEYEPAGNEMPFWAQARLGGDQSGGRQHRDAQPGLRRESVRHSWHAGNRAVCRSRPSREPAWLQPSKRAAPGGWSRLSWYRGAFCSGLRGCRLWRSRRRHLLRHQLPVLEFARIFFVGSSVRGHGMGSLLRAAAGVRSSRLRRPTLCPTPRRRELLP
jgi:hypothetical protein